MLTVQAPAPHETVPTCRSDSDSMTLRRYHLAATESRDLVLGSAVDRCVQLAQERSTHEMALALASKDQLIGPLADVLGAEAVRALERDNVHVRKGLVMYLLTEKIQRRRMQGPVLATGISAALLGRVVMARGVTDVVFVPDSSENLADYLVQFSTSEEFAVSGMVRNSPLCGSQGEASSVPQGQG